MSYKKELRHYCATTKRKEHDHQSPTTASAKCLWFSFLQRRRLTKRALKNRRSQHFTQDPITLKKKTKQIMKEKKKTESFSLSSPLFNYSPFSVIFKKEVISFFSSTSSVCVFFCMCSCNVYSFVL